MSPCTKFPLSCCWHKDIHLAVFQAEWPGGDQVAGGARAFPWRHACTSAKPKGRSGFDKLTHGFNWFNCRCLIAKAAKKASSLPSQATVRNGTADSRTGSVSKKRTLNPAANFWTYAILYHEWLLDATASVLGSKHQKPYLATPKP